MKNIIMLFAMLLFLGLSTTPVVAQTSDKLVYNKGNVILVDSLTNVPKDTITVNQFIEIQKELPMQKQVDMNKKLFEAMRKEDQ